MTAPERILLYQEGRELSRGWCAIADVWLDPALKQDADEIARTHNRRYYEYLRSDLAVRAYHAAALARIADLEAKADRAEDELAELRRQLGGGCQANSGNDHLVIKQGSYSFCGNCGESLRGIRFCHLPRHERG